MNTSSFEWAKLFSLNDIDYKFKKINNKQADGHGHGHIRIYSRN
jgi:hypothetical protein